MHVYAFIDSQNLYAGIRSAGWRMDYRKFRLFLRNRYNVAKAFIFIGLVPDNETLYDQLRAAGFILIFKPTIVHIIDGQKVIKGNVDAELVLHAAAIEYQNYDKAIIVSADGDFVCLVKFLIERDKLLHILSPHKRYSGLLRKYSTFIILIDRFRHNLQKK